MNNELNTESPKACKEILAHIFSDYEALIARIAPKGWDNSPYKRFLHPTPEQQYEEYKIISDNISRLSKKETGIYELI